MAWDMLFWPIFAGFKALAFLFALVVFVLWVWMIVDCAKRDFRNQTEKIIWIIVTIFLGWLGALLYFVLIKNGNPRGFYKK